MIRRPPRSTHYISSAASDLYKRQSKELSILIQAIKALGKDNINEEHIKKLAVFAQNIKEDLKEDTLRLPFWIQEVLEKIQEINHE